MDYPEHDIEEITGRAVYEDALNIRKSLAEIAESFDKGRILREGIRVVIAGKPNVGKSSLLNELVGKNKAIVTDIPGTTRDIIEEYVSIKGIPVKLADTAGIRKTADPIEKIGVEKAEGAMEAAELIILMLDASRGLDEEDKSIIRKLSGKKTIYIINKTDMADEAEVSAIEDYLGKQKQRDGSLDSKIQGDGSAVLEENISGGTFPLITAEEKIKKQRDGSLDSKIQGDVSAVLEENIFGGSIPPVIAERKIIRASMLLGKGLDELEQTIGELFIKGNVTINNEVLVTNIRHKNLLDMSIASLQEACRAYEGGMPLDMITIDIKNAAEYLGRITGESVSEDVVQEIFSRFCIGK